MYLIYHDRIKLIENEYQLLLFIINRVIVMLKSY